MIHLTCPELQEQMNRLGRRRQPFVWAISYDMEDAIITADPLNDNEILWHVGTNGNFSHLTPDRMPQMQIWRNIGIERYSEMFDTVIHGLRRGDSFLANLTAATEISLNGSLRDVFLCSSAPYRLLIGDSFVCFSPEPFVVIKGGLIYTFPMKGTADATIPGAERRLLDDYKETCEHYTIVDLMRNDLNSVACDVCVERFRYVEHISTTSGSIIQTSSEIRGRIPEGKEYDFGDLIIPMLPAGSITGAPKEATIALINKAETAPRGWYTGVFGHFDGEKMTTAVMIRCLQRHTDGSLRFHSGGGITVNSVMAEEYQELIDKIYLTVS